MRQEAISKYAAVFKPDLVSSANAFDQGKALRSQLSCCSFAYSCSAEPLAAVAYAPVRPYALIITSWRG
jgi:hypothetical protein